MAMHNYLVEDNEPSRTDGQIVPLSDVNFWDSFLTHQLRVLLYAEPLLELRRRDEHRPTEMKHYDSLSLALKLFHQIIEHTGLEHEIDSAGAINVLLPLLMAMDRAEGLEPDRQRQTLMAERVLAALRNDKEGQRAFKISYTDFEKGQAIERILAVRLLEERYHNDGHIVLGLSNELTNLLLNALTIDIEDAQAATEAIIQSQLARGRFYEAINSARQARFHSVRLRAKIERILMDTKRDIRRVDWKAEVPQMLAEALEHISTRCSVEISIATSAREKRETLDAECEEVRQLSEIIALVEDCRQRHMELQQQLSGARQIFFNEQERQAFTLRTTTYFPHLLSDVLEPLLQAPRTLVETVMVPILPLCLGACAPRVFSLSQYIVHQLQPRREKPLETVPEEQRELGMVENDQPFYSPEVIRLADTYLARFEKPTRLGDLLQEAVDAGEPTEVVELLALLVLRRFAPQEKDESAFTVLKIDDGQFFTGGISGDNVFLYPGEDAYV